MDEHAGERLPGARAIHERRAQPGVSSRGTRAHAQRRGAAGAESAEPDAREVVRGTEVKSEAQIKGMTLEEADSVTPGG
jgi:hypothetical protein